MGRVDFQMATNSIRIDDVKRVAHRAQAGGYDVPPEKIRTRYRRSPLILEVVT